jgi:hypothetical protein
LKPIVDLALPSAGIPGLLPHRPSSLDLAAMVNIPAFQSTPVERIAVVHDRLSKSFLSHKTRPLEWRLTQLRKLYWG